MNLGLKIFAMIIYLCMSFSAIIAFSQEAYRWVSIGPLVGQPVDAIAIDPQRPQTLYAGTYFGGVFKSTNAAGSWSPVNTGLTNLEVSALAIDPQSPQTLLAGKYEDGVFKSFDGGGSWSPVNTGLTDLRVFSLAIGPQSPGNVFAGTQGGGVFKLQQEPLPATIPTLTEWGMILLIMLLGIASVYYLRRQWVAG